MLGTHARKENPMPPIQIPNLVPSGFHTQQGIQGYQNALVTRSNLDTAKLQQNALGMQNQEMAQAQQKRAELESLLSQTPEPDRDRVAFEWSKVKDPEFHLK